jgi:hypothetical protein
VVTDPLAGVTRRRDKTDVGGEPVGTLEGADVAYAHQELGPEDRTHPWQASENPSLRTGEKTLLELLVEGADTLLEVENIFGELGDNCGGYLLCRQSNALGSGRGKCLVCYVIGSFDGAVSLG